MGDIQNTNIYRPAVSRSQYISTALILQNWPQGAGFVLSVSCCLYCSSTCHNIHISGILCFCLSCWDIAFCIIALCVNLWTFKSLSCARSIKYLTALISDYFQSQVLVKYKESLISPVSVMYLAFLVAKLLVHTIVLKKLQNSWTRHSVICM